MSETTTTVGTDLLPAYKAGQIALRDGARLGEVAETLIETVEVTHVPSTTAVPFPDLPKAPEITAEDKRALLDLPKVFGQVVMDTPRTLAPNEIADLAKERSVVKRITSLLKGREEAIGEYIRTHVDSEATAAGIGVPKDVVRGGKVIVEATPRDDAGHYILAAKGNPTRVHIEGTNEDFSLEYRAGRSGTVTISGEDLLDLYESGQIDRADYLALTRETRVFDEDKARKACIDNPALLGVIAQVTRRTGAGSPGTSLYVRKAK